MLVLSASHSTLYLRVERSAGNIAPMAVGVSLVLDLFAAAAYSGGGVSPARVLGPAIVFHCHWNTAWVYMLGGELILSLPAFLPGSSIATGMLLG